MRDHLTKTGKTVARWHGYPDVDPAIWVTGASGLEWIVVRAVRFPELDAAIPGNWQEIVKACAQFGKVGYFASVGVASANDAFDASGEVPAEPLWRGHAMRVRFHGLVSVPPPGFSRVY